MTPGPHSCGLTILTRGAQSIVSAVDMRGGGGTCSRAAAPRPDPAGVPPSPPWLCNRSRSRGSCSRRRIAQVSADRLCPVFLRSRRR